MAQPNPSNPLGNPIYPGYTSSNGPNWVDFLTTTYNQSFIETVNLAYGGATVDANLVAAYRPTVLSVQQQVESEYLSTYTPAPSFLPWKSSNTLFSIFIGINDVGNSYASQNSTLASDIFTVYSGLLDELYLSGARNFLFLNVPPVDRSPLTTAQGASSQALEAAAISDWNRRVAAQSRNLTSTYHDVISFLFDTNKVFTQVLDNPCTYPQTCAYKNTTAYCDAYADGTPSWYTYNASCRLSVDEYFWLNSLHPTFRMHNVTAELVARELSLKWW